MSNKKIIFFNAYSPRTGHNFASEVLKVVCNHQVLIHSKSETRLSTLLESYYSLYHSHIYHQTDKAFFDYLFIDDLREKILAKTEAEFALIKDTSFNGVSHLKKVFPNDIHILLIRDPRDVLLSLFKGMRLKRPGWKYALKRLLLPTGIYSYWYARKFSAKILKTLPDFTGFILVRYEDLVMQDENTLHQLKTLFHSNKSMESIKTEIDAIEVVNTSFIDETKAKRIWDAKPKTATFRPIKRRPKNRLILWGILLGSRKLRKKLNYS